MLEWTMSYVPLESLQDCAVKATDIPNVYLAPAEGRVILACGEMCFVISMDGAAARVCAPSADKVMRLVK